MTNSKITKKALLGSTISLVLCFAMLLGTTFAWFTDSASSANNRIVAGNLDVDLLMDKTEQNNYESIAGSTGDIFSETGNGIKWEPGKTEIVYLAVRNKGSLALKYNIILDITDGNPGLIGSLEYALLDKAKASDLAAATKWTDIIRTEGVQSELVQAGQHTAAPNGVLEGKVNNVEDTDYFALAVHMKEEAGNEYMNGSITIDVKVVATQKDAEEDSFGSDYDKEASLDYYPVSSADELRTALANQNKNIVITGDISTEDTYTVDYDVTINGAGYEIKRADGYTGTIFNVTAGSTLTLTDVVIDGGAVWASRSANPSTSTNSGITATGNLINAGANSHIVLNKDTVLQNNDGALAINLGTRIGATLTLNGAQIVYNRSDAGAIWGGGHITINEGTKISYNSSNGVAGAIRMVSNCNLTMNGGEISHNTASTDGGAIWGYGSSTYNFNGGSIAYNTASGIGGGMYLGTYSVINMSGDFKMVGNTASNSGAMRLTDHNTFNMTGGEISGNASAENSNFDAFYCWDTAVTLTGGELKDDVYIDSGLTPTVGGNGITGVIHFSVHNVHNTVNLANNFGTITFTVDEGRSNFASFNLKPDADYVYTEGDEAKLVCKNEGYKTYWDETTKTFRLTAK